MNAVLERSAQRLRLADGRILGYQMFGAADGPAMYFLHGFPGSRSQAALVHPQALAAGIALLAPERPGCGESTLQPGRTIAGYADDVRQLADHLGHHHFGVLGVSCGGPYALACAGQLPERVFHVSLLAGMGALRQARLRQGQLPPLRLLFGLARWQPRLCTPLLALDRWLWRTAPDRTLRSLASWLTPPDQQLLKLSAETARVFVHSLTEAYTQGIAGVRDELRLLARYDAADLSTIRQTVHVHQAGQDRHVPPPMARDLAARLPHATLHEHADEGHLSIVLHRFGDCARQFLHDRASHLHQGETP